MHMCMRVRRMKASASASETLCARERERERVDENVRIVATQAHALDIALAALAHTVCGATTLHMHRQV